MSRTKNMSRAEKLEYLRQRQAKLVAKYNSEYEAGKWTTNRRLESACVNAWDDYVRALNEEGVQS